MDITQIISDNKDDEEGPPVKLHINATESGIDIRPEGYGCAGMQDGHGYPITIEIYAGELRVIVWDDINDQDPTYIIPMDQAKETERKA